MAAAAVKTPAGRGGSACADGVDFGIGGDAGNADWSDHSGSFCLCRIERKAGSRRKSID